MFLGREKELTTLKDRLNHRAASFIAIRGRRRIGKSRLIEEYSKQFKHKYLFSGLPPVKGLTADNQRQTFAEQMNQQGLPHVQSEGWSSLFWILGQATAKGQVLIVLDEIAWMGSKDPNFLGQLKIAWDQFFSKNSKLILIVASSISSWLDENILNSTGFFGRVDVTMTLHELPLSTCCEFWGKFSHETSAYDKLKMLAVCGGVPKYLEAINPRKSAEQNIMDLCFSPHGLLFHEFDRIFHDLFGTRGSIYKEIIQALAKCHSLTQKEVCKAINRENGRAISTYLEDLCTAGFITHDVTWNIKSEAMSNLRKVRLSDNYLRFYIRYVEPHKHKIIKGLFDGKSLTKILQWDSIMGLQLENLIIHNLKDLYPKIGIEPHEVIISGPFFQTKTQRKRGCQIDCLIQTKQNTLYVCEIKFSRASLGQSITNAVKEKINRLSIPRHFSYRPVLIYIGDLTHTLIEEDYFYRTIDASDLLA